MTSMNSLMYLKNMHVYKISGRKKPLTAVLSLWKGGGGAWGVLLFFFSSLRCFIL